MCSRYTLTSRPELVRDLFEYEELADFPPRYNIAPTQPVPIVRISPKRTREFALVRWGLIPSWVKEPGEFTTLINARSETILEKPSFRTAMRHRRCLFPADAFYEWAGMKGHKHAYMIRPCDGGMMAFAGVWEHWMSAEGSEMESAAIITVRANQAVKTVHDRAPAILAREQFENWLDCDRVMAGEAADMLGPAKEGLLEVIEISTLVNNPQNDDPRVQAPVDERLI